MSPLLRYHAIVTYYLFSLEFIFIRHFRHYFSFFYHILLRFLAIVISCSLFPDVIMLIICIILNIADVFFIVIIAHAVIFLAVSITLNIGQILLSFRLRAHYYFVTFQLHTAQLRRCRRCYFFCFFHYRHCLSISSWRWYCFFLSFSVIRQSFHISRLFATAAYAELT